MNFLCEQCTTDVIHAKFELEETRNRKFDIMASEIVASINGHVNEFPIVFAQVSND